jgi:hypothetical protein
LHANTHYTIEAEGVGAGLAEVAGDVVRSLDVVRDDVTVRDVVRDDVTVRDVVRVLVIVRDGKRDDVRDSDAEYEGELVRDKDTDATDVGEYVRGVLVRVAEYEAGVVPVSVTDDVGGWDLNVVRVTV